MNATSHDRSPLVSVAIPVYNPDIWDLENPHGRGEVTISRVIGLFVEGMSGGDVIGRLMHMQIDLYSMVSAINGIVAQRLVRVICPHCAEDDVPADAILSASGLAAESVADFKFRFARGCGHCRGSGYRGRKAIAELLLLNDEIRELIATRAPIRKIKEAARANGTRFLRESALDMVRSGETTLQEINRVTFVA